VEPRCRENELPLVFTDTMASESKTVARGGIEPPTYRFSDGSGPSTRVAARSTPSNYWIS